MNEDTTYTNVRNILTQLVASGRGRGARTETLQRYYELIRLYDTICMKAVKGCVFAVYGSPKMGKSTLFNSIMGAAVLPCHPIPTTGAIIDLKRDDNRDDYEIVYTRKGVTEWVHRKTPESVCDFLDKHAAQQQPCDSVTVTGPFPNAANFITDKCTLRDTPGAEALIDSPTRLVDDRLQADSDKALRSLKDPCIPLFCLSAKTIGQQQDVDFYSAHFRSRCCLHVITHIDAITQDLKSQQASDVKDDFTRKFNITPSDANPRPMVLTGICNAPDGETMVNLGKEELIQEMQNLMDPERLGKQLCKVAEFILNHTDIGIDWDPGPNKNLLLAQLNHALHYFIP